MLACYFKSLNSGLVTLVASTWALSANPHTHVEYAKSLQNVFAGDRLTLQSDLPFNLANGGFGSESRTPSTDREDQGESVSSLARNQHGALVSLRTRCSETASVSSHRHHCSILAYAVDHVVTSRAADLACRSLALVPAASQTAAIKRVCLSSIRAVAFLYARAPME